MGKKLRLYAYYRFSTRMQAESGNLENQRCSINKFIEIHDYKYEIVCWFEEDGISVFKDSPAYDRMVEKLIDDNYADSVIVVRLDRNANF